MALQRPGLINHRQPNQMIQLMIVNITIAALPELSGRKDRRTWSGGWLVVFGELSCPLFPIVLRILPGLAKAKHGYTRLLQHCNDGRNRRGKRSEKLGDMVRVGEGRNKEVKSSTQ